MRVKRADAWAASLSPYRGKEALCPRQVVQLIQDLLPQRRVQVDRLDRLVAHRQEVHRRRGILGRTQEVVNVGGAVDGGGSKL